MKTLIFSFLCIFLFSHSVKGQVYDDFSDGNILENPFWAGDVKRFFVNDLLMLQSNGDSTLSSFERIFLSTPSDFLDDAEWEFFVNPRVSTSSNNLMDVFVCSDSMNLRGNINGYFVRIGGTPDEVALFRRDGISETKIIAGKPGSINGSTNNPTRVRVRRDSAGSWTLWANYEGSSNDFEFVGNATDNIHRKTSWFGILIKYSNSNRMKYFVDDIQIGPWKKDKTAPKIIGMHTITGNEIELTFSEELNQSAVDTSNYWITANNSKPVSAMKNLAFPEIIRLTFNKEFPEKEPLALRTHNLRDKSGNPMADSLFPFVYYPAKPYDIQINEIMADPEPSAGMPQCEYIELFNRTDFPVCLYGWKIRAGMNSKQLPIFTIHPKKFIVLTSFSGAPLFGDSIPVLPVVAMPGLLNNGSELVLTDKNETVISYINYQDSWYKNAVKMQGGWALEQESIMMPCAGEENWRASESEIGGTPGKENSISKSTKDVSNPYIKRIMVLNPDTIQVFFSESISSESSSDPDIYNINEGIGHPLKAEPIAPSFHSVKLTLANPLEIGINYLLTAGTEIRDCSGNLIENILSEPFAIPAIAVKGDVIINEIMPDPKPGGVDYIEIYNRSHKTINVGKLQIGSRNNTTENSMDNRLIQPEGFLLFPGRYALLSASPKDVLKFYSAEGISSFIDLESMPPCNDESGTLVLSRVNDNQVIDEVSYSRKMHYPLLGSFEGVSLERIHFDRPSDDETNWISASALVNYGTPGFKNSQFSDNLLNGNSKMTIEPEVFSPNGDGNHDIIQIGYEFDMPGFNGNITIFNSNGRIEKYLIKNKLLGKEGLISWNGVNENNNLAATGLYIAFLEAFSPEGKTIKIKKAFILGD